MNKTFLLLLFLGFGFVQAQAQHKIACIGFYNFENLFDTLDTENVRDTEFTPTGDKVYNTKVYEEKLSNLSKVVAQMGTKETGDKIYTPDGVALLGVCEIENKSVLEDFVKHPNVKDRNYQIVHYDSPDKRGIDVALLYQPKYFKVLESGAINPNLKRDGKTVYTRDVLWVKGEFDGEIIHVMVCHWPSRRGGEKASSPLREGAAKACRDKMDEILAEDPKAKIFLMGDLNDDPVNNSVKKVIGAKRKKDDVKENGFYNPMWEYYKKGLGTLAYRDAWNLFDQMLLSQAWLPKEQEGYRYYQSLIFKKPFLIQKSGRFQGYPLRTYSFGKYVGGYSDHLPVYTYLVKPAK